MVQENLVGLQSAPDPDAGLGGKEDSSDGEWEAVEVKKIERRKERAGK